MTEPQSVLEEWARLVALEREQDALRAAIKRLSSALSQIDYLCGEPNEQNVSGYDVHCDEEAVVEHVRTLKAHIESLAPEAEERETRAAYEQLKRERDALLTVAQAANGILYGPPGSLLSTQCYKANKTLRDALAHPLVQALLSRQ